MKKILAMAMLCLTIGGIAIAQDNDDKAKASFTAAEIAYANGNYKDAVSNIMESERYAGGANSKSLYLKIRALDQVATADPSYLPQLNSSMDRFFEVTDKSLYPQDKYAEISAIYNRRKGGTAAPTTPVTVAAPTSKNAQEAADYEKAVKKNTLEAYKEFLDTYSYTPHYAEIKRRYQELVEDDDEYRHHHINH